MTDATYIPCMYLGDDETILTALKQAIEDHDSPELLRVQPFGKNEPGGLWVITNLVAKGELDKARTDGRWYRDGRSTLEWVWNPDEVYAELEQLNKLNVDKFNTIQAYCKAASEDKAEVAKLKGILVALNPAPLVDLLNREIDEAMAAVDACLKMSNGRESEWGERAVAAIGFLHELCIKRQERRTTRNLVAPWASYMEIHPMDAGKIWVRWCGIDGVYRWLHPERMAWVEEPEQIDMPTFPDYQSARSAAGKSPEPPTWSEFVLHQASERIADANLEEHLNGAG